jgi:uncharacterized protein YifE (UPF0438 family)
MYVSKEPSASSIRAAESATQEKKEFVTVKRKQRLAETELEHCLMEAILLCLILNKPHLFSITQVFLKQLNCPHMYVIS